MNRAKSSAVTTAVAALLALSLFAASARAEDLWTLTTADFKTESVTPTAIDDSGVTLAPAATTDGTAGAATTQPAARVVPMASFVQLLGPARSKPPVGLVLCGVGGERLVGSPRKIDGPNLVWFTSGVGDVAVPLESVLAIVRDRATPEGLADVRAEDRAKLVSGDSVGGILTDADDGSFVFTPSAGDPVKVAPAAVASILFATPPGGRKAAAPPAFLIRIAGGSVVAASRVNLAGNELSFTSVSGVSLKVPWTQVEGLDHTGGPVAWLSSREPTESIYTPYLDGRFPARMDSSVVGGPIRFGGVTYAHGIGVHSRSKITFAVEPGDRTFRTRYAIDPGAPRADVDVAIYVGSQRLHWKTGFKAGVLSPLIELNLGDAKTITLEVDYGSGYDVQDRLNWIEPAIVRE